LALKKVLAALLLLLLGCSEQPTEAFRFGFASAPTTLDPRYATDAVSSRITRLLYRALVDFDNSAQPVAALATWQTMSPTRYRFRLKEGPGRRFHNGHRLTAWDVQASYESVLDPKTASPHRSLLAGIRRIQVFDEDTMEFRLTAPDPLFPGRLTLGILPKGLLQQGHDFSREPVGSGPFVFRDWPDEGRLRLARRVDGQVVVFVRVADPTVRAIKLLRGEIDLIQGDLPPELVHWLRTRPEVMVERAAGTHFTYLGFNMEDPVVGQRTVRQAIAHALDREAIVRHLMGGAARLASALLPPDHWAGHPSLPRIEYDPAKAHALLRAAGYTSRRRPHVVYKTSSDPFRVRLATVIQDQLQRVGFTMDVKSYDWGTFYGDIKAGRFQMYSLSWVGIKMPDIFRYAFHSASLPPRGANRGHLVSRTADRLIEQAEGTPSVAEQARLFRVLQAYLLDELPYVPLWYEDNVLVARRGLGGYRLASDGNYDGLVGLHRVPDDNASK
jgi:peptide/nickel transport system substrate-binding protein